jgi:hypothetical protein
MIPHRADHDQVIFNQRMDFKIRIVAWCRYDGDVYLAIRQPLLNNAAIADRSRALATTRTSPIKLR